MLIRRMGGGVLYQAGFKHTVFLHVLFLFWRHAHLPQPRHWYKPFLLCQTINIFFAMGYHCVGYGSGGNEFQRRNEQDGAFSYAVSFAPFREGLLLLPATRSRSRRQRFPKKKNNYFCVFVCCIFAISHASSNALDGGNKQGCAFSCASFSN